MPKHTNDRLQGTLDLLILKTLARGGPQHGYAIAQRIHQGSNDLLRIEEGSIFAVVERVVLNPLPYADSDRIVELDHGAQRLNIPAGFGITPGLYYQYSE